MKHFVVYKVLCTFVAIMGQENEVTISLIIPVYNVSPYIERCLKSVMEQTYDRFECILVDDASPDDSIAKCEGMIADYQGPIQFHLLHHQQNRGLSAARNTGTDAAKGDYILYVDSDDTISNDCVEKLMAPVLADRSIEVVYGASMTITAKGKKFVPKIYQREKVEFKTLREVRDFYLNRQRPFIHAAWNKLTSRDFIRRHGLRFMEGLLWEDALWTFFEMKHLSHLVFVPDVTYIYYQRPDSITFGTDAASIFFHKNIIADTISRNFTPGDEAKEADKYLLDFCYYYIRQPKSPELRDTARRFGQALPWRQYTKDRILLTAANLLPRNGIGIRIFNHLKKRLH